MITLQLPIKILTALILFLMNLTYLGINLFDFSSEMILSMRIIATSIIIAIFAMKFRISKNDQIILVFVAITAISAITSSIALNLLFIFLFILATRSLSAIFLATASTYILGATVMLTIILVQFDVVDNIEDVVGSAVELGGEFRTRMTFGYKNVNAFSAVVSSLCLLFLFTGKNIVLRTTIALFISYIFYTYTDSRTMLLTTILFIIFAITFEALLNHRRIFLTISTAIIITPIVLTALSTIIDIRFPLIDLIFSGRLTFVSIYISILPIYSLFVGGIDPPSNLTIDNSFALLLGAAGIPILIYLAQRMLIVIKKCAIESDYRKYAFMMSFWLFSFAESSIVRPETLICLIFWMILLKNSDNDKLATKN